MFRINDDSSSSSNNITKQIRNDSSSIIIHEHDFVSIRTEREEKEQKSIICLTCGSLYCEKCGKLLGTLYD